MCVCVGANKNRLGIVGGGAEILVVSLKNKFRWVATSNLNHKLRVSFTSGSKTPRNSKANFPSGLYTLLVHRGNNINQ